ncbi:MAG: nucleotidyl transferase AbiEii/AbiGii toxin family protein [Candidatus Aminicenantes bacterium]
MEKPKENKNCYASPIQREILLKFLTHPFIRESFFLTGGTALSVFYLYHRVSDDLDLFSLQSVDFSEIDYWLRSSWKETCSKIKQGPNFLSFLIEGTKVDFVIDALSNKKNRERVEFENDQSILIDNIDNIASNKLSCIVSRTEPKDFIDTYFLFKNYSDLKIEDVYKNAKSKDAIFDDPPTAAFQLEEGISFIKENPSLMPDLKRELNFKDVINFFEDLLEWIYAKFKVK